MIITKYLHFNKLFIWQFAAFMAVVLGIYARFIGLNNWSLATDEYFIVKSTDYILEKGVPQFQCGGYYMRGLLMQYFIATERLLGIPPNFAVRFASAISFFISLPALFLLGRRIGGNTIAYASIILFSLSAWEIEFARFGRMYALFQSVFLWYLIFLVKAVVDGCRSSRYKMYLLTVISLFLWEGAIFLALLNFLPTELNYKKIKWQDWLVSGVIFVAVYLFLTTNFRYMGQDNPLPTLNLSDEQNNTGDVKNKTSSFAILNNIWYLLGAIPLGISLWGAIRIVKSKSLHWITQAYLFLLILFSLLHLFNCIIYITIIFLLYDPDNFLKAVKLKGKLILVIILSCLIFWLIYYLVGSEALMVLANEGKIKFAKEGINFLFGFPNILNGFIYKWLPVMPFLFVSFLSLLTFYIYSIIANKKHNEYSVVRFLLIIIITLIYIVGVVRTPVYSTRYLFFIYPILVILTVYFLQFLINYLHIRNYFHTSMAISIIMLMLIAKDWNVNHILYVDDYDINFRTIYRNDYDFTNHYYARRDQAEIAEFINKKKGEDDVVIITDFPFEYYLDKTDYVYRHYNDNEFSAISCDHGTLERWSNKPLIYTENELYSVIENAKDYVWLILLERRVDLDQINLRNKYKKAIIHMSPDKEFIVYKIPGEKRY